MYTWDSSLLEPPIKDALRTNLSTKDNLKVPLYTHSIQNNLQKRTTSPLRTKGWVPSVSIIQKFTVIYTTVNVSYKWASGESRMQWILKLPMG